MAFNSDIESIDWHSLKNQAETLKKIIRPTLNYLYIFHSAKLKVGQGQQPDFPEGEQLLVIADDFLHSIDEFNSKLQDSILGSQIAILARLHFDYMNNRAEIQPNCERVDELLRTSVEIKNNILNVLIDLEKFLLGFINQCEVKIETINNLSSIKNLINESKSKTYALYDYFMKNLITLNAGALVALLAYLSQSKIGLPIAKHAITIFGNNLIILLFIVGGITVILALRGKFLQEMHDKYKGGSNDQSYVEKFKNIKHALEIFSIALLIPFVHFIYGVYYSFGLLK